ncbi:hypothetical protein [Halobiforma nitratireducens]|uniref:Uncharacterized protein n=1 Tax=Halobiforma nitratireducens JCM 10879 TaxID=1227454 RepID=M0MNA3_9EURY|nr:hypothetical protein [Halobiforma nitratireducens]EMA47131.1 hypothetical protein C446_00410 [Halobiforma nitratireducens JCM 10879]
MKRALTLTLTVALIGSLMFMGFAGTAAAQDELVDVDIGNQTTGDATATTDIDINQENNNAQLGAAEAQTGDAIALNDGANGGALAAGQQKGGAAGVAGATDDGGAYAANLATADVNQAQDVDQTNNAEVSNVTTSAESGDNVGVGVETDIEFDGNISVGDL